VDKRDEADGAKRRGIGSQLSVNGEMTVDPGVRDDGESRIVNRWSDEKAAAEDRGYNAEEKLKR